MREQSLVPRNKIILGIENQGRDWMGSHIVIEGNAFYEVDDDCLERKKKELQREKKKGSTAAWRSERGERTEGDSPVPDFSSDCVGLDRRCHCSSSLSCLVDGKSCGGV